MQQRCRFWYKAKSSGETLYTCSIYARNSTATVTGVGNKKADLFVGDEIVSVNGTARHAEDGALKMPMQDIIKLFMNTPVRATGKGKALVSGVWGSRERTEEAMDNGTTKDGKEAMDNGATNDGHQG